MKRKALDFFRCKGNKVGMTLIEILVAIALLGVVCVTLMPVMSFSIKSLNFSNQHTAALFDAQGKLEVVEATKSGILFSDGTFLPYQNFPLGYGRLVPGATVLQSDIVKFMAGIPNIKLNQVPIVEGYCPDSGSVPNYVEILVAGKSTHFISGDTKVRIYKENGTLLFSSTSPASDFIITDKENARIRLPMGYLNEESPYRVVIDTGSGSEMVSNLLVLGQPYYVSLGNLKILSSQEPDTYWRQRDDGVSGTVVVNHVIYVKQPLIEECFLAVGKKDLNGLILRKENEDVWTELSVPAIAGNPLNGLAANGNILVVVGDNGIILTSEDGVNWVRRASGQTSESLKSVTAINIPSGEAGNAIKFIAVGTGETILTSEDGITWIAKQTDGKARPTLTANVFIGNGAQPGFDFDSTQLIKTVSAPVVGNSARSVFMMLRPALGAAPNSDTLIEWGQIGGPIPPATAGPRWTMRVDGTANSLRVERGGAGATSALAVSSLPTIVGHSWDGSTIRMMTQTTTASTVPWYSYSTSLDNVNTANLPAYLGGPISGWRSTVTKDFMYKGHIAEILVYDVALDESTATTVTNYLSNKYIGEVVGAPPSPPNGNLKLWLKADQAEPGIINGKNVLWKDLSGQNNHAGPLSINSVAYGRLESNPSGKKNVMIAVGEAGNLYRSYNCTDWERIVKNTEENFNWENITDIEYGNGWFITVGNAGRIARSQDGTSWTSDSFGTGNLNDIDYKSYSAITGIWLIAGNNKQILTTEAIDGTGWAQLPASGIKPDDMPVTNYDNFCITHR